MRHTRWCLTAYVAAFSVVLGLANEGSGAQPLLTREEALALAFPGAVVSADRVFLTEQQMKAASGRAGIPIPSALVARYTARLNAGVVGRAYVDTHTVRTKRESLLVSVDASGRLKRVDVIAFLEPPEYRATPPFLSQFTGRELEDDLRLQRAIRPLAGATLTASAVTDAVRRVLAIDKTLQETERPRSGGPAL